ncbi:amino acid adenylation domain-containing protein [Bacillus sp. C1]
MFNKSDIKDLYELSPLQKGMLFHYLHDKGNQAYFEQIDFTIEGTINLSSLEESFNQLIKKYDIFRTVFLYEKVNQPIQVVLKERKAKIHFENISYLDRDKDKYIEEFKEEERRKGFDLSSDILIRLSLIQTDSQKYHLIWSFHHILMDGWCLGLVLGDLFQMYQRYLKNEEIVLERVTPYSQYIRWLAKQNKVTAQSYWKEYLQGFNQVTEIPFSQSKEMTYDYAKKELSLKIDSHVTSQLEKLAKSYQVTQNTIFRAIWGILLQRYNNTNDVVFGTVISGRPAEIPNVEKIVGLFINTIPVRVQSKPHDTFVDLIKRIQQAASESERYNYMSLADIQGNTELTGELFKHLVAFENFPLDTESVDKKGEELGFTIKDAHTFEQTNYDLNLLVLPGSEWEIRVNFNQEVYDVNLVGNMFEDLEVIMRQVIAQPEIQIEEIEVVSEKAMKQLMEFGRKKIDYPRDKTIHELFEQQVENTPEHTALVLGNDSVTYRELNQRANQLAHYLCKNGIKPGALVGIAMERSIDLYVGMLAILKSGGAYVPLDPNYPKERLAYLFTDSQIPLLLTHEKLLSMLPDYSGQIICLDQEREQIREEEKTNLLLSGSGDDLAYVMYTSGSTGKPKGVSIVHRGVVRLVKENDYAQLDESKTLLQLAPTAFDASTFEIWGSFLNGGRLAIMPPGISTMEQIAKEIERNQVTTLWLTAGLFKLVVDHQLEALKGVHQLLVGGDVVSVPHVQKVLQLGGVQVINGYGPTENTTFTCCYPVPADWNGKALPIGRPIKNTEVYILDSRLKPVPVGVPGELYIGGDGLAREYLNRPDLTQERFIPNLFSNDSNERLYKTGDLVRYLSDGHIEFIERMDNQVKIRGFRIELGEIEAVLSQHPSVKDIVMSVTGEKQLVAYIVPEHQVIGLEDQWREYLKGKLPDYMIPSAFIIMEAIPLTPNGKIDKKALPKLDEGTQTGMEYAPPTNPTEDALVQIWQEVLQVKRVGIYDHFFEIGGHSLKAMMLVSRILKNLQVQVPIKEVFSRPTVKEMAAYIKEAEGSSYPTIAPVKKQEYYPVSSMQKRLYTIQLLDGIHTTYNMPLVLKIEGALDIDQLTKAFRLLIQRHESFRTTFELIDGELVQKIHSKVPFQIEQCIAEQGDQVKDLVQAFIRPFDLKEAPLCRVRLITLAKERYILLIDMHHIISDGISMGVIIRELTELYQGKVLPALHLQYKDYAVWQQSFKETKFYQKQEEYWVNELKGDIPVLELPTDYPRPPIQKFDGRLFSYELSEELTKKVKEFNFDQGTTLFMTLFAIYNVVLYKYSGQEDIIVGSPVAGRTQSDLESIVGMFVNTIAIRNNPKETQTFQQFLANVKSNVLAAYEHADYPLEGLIDKLEIRRDLSRNPLFDTMFIMQNMEKSELQFSGLTIEPEKFEWENTKMDMSWTIEESEKIHILLEYSTQLFKPETIQRMVKHFVSVLEQIIKNPNIYLGELKLITEKEKEQLLVEFNNTKVEYPRDKVVHELFEEQVEKTPNHIAVVYNEKKLTYHELNERANQLAHVLREKGVTKEKIVGILVKPSLEMLIGVLGVLKAGGGYLPIDPTYPSDRIQYMLTDSQAEWLLTQEKLETPANYTGETILLDQEELYQGEGTNLTYPTDLHDLAYVIYTSGSTGKPKGVQLEQGSFLNMCYWNIDYYQLTEKDHVTKYAGFGFDASVWEIFPSLIAGSTLYIIPEEMRLDVEKLNAYFEKNQITVSFLPTQICEQFLPLANQSLRTLQTAGDKLTQSVKHPLARYTLVNNYGPTENTVVATAYRIEGQVGNIPIGKPIANSKIYIVDRLGNLAPIGVAGELCIAGESLARGYLNQPELTAEKFVDNPFEPGTKMYKTGDLAKWLSDGNIAFMGRIDHQVKIRGYRIELGEIESVLSQHPSVKTAIVNVTDEKQLVTYVVPEPDVEDQTDQWRQYLSGKLPEYMIPIAFITMDEIPLTSNGKVDRKALLELKDYIQTKVDYVAPTSQVEETIAEIWKEIFNLNRVGIYDNFFELGGDSIKGMQLIARLYKHRWKLELKNLYVYPTIAEIIPYIEMIHESKEEIIEGEVPFTPIQKWIFEHTPDQLPDIYINIMLENKEGWHIESVKTVFKKLAEHHDALRMVYMKTEEIVQINRGSAEDIFSLHVFDLTKEQNELQRIEQEVHQLNKRGDLIEGPLVKLSIFQAADQNYLVISIHHLLMDDMSANILIDDFITSYKQIVQKEPIILPPSTTSYQTWSKKLQEYANSESFLKELPYWIAMESGSVKQLPKDMEGPDTCTVEELDVISLIWTEEETKNGFGINSQKRQAKPFEVLLTALGMTISEWNNEDKVLINLERHGREEILDGVDVTRTIGWFNAHAPVILPMQSKEWKSAIHSVQKVLNYMPNKGVGYGILKYLTAPEKKDSISFQLRPEVSFNYHGYVNQELKEGFTQSIQQTGSSFSSKVQVPFSLYISAIILDGRLQVSFGYNKYLYTRDTIQKLTEQFKENLNLYMVASLERV